MSFYAHVKALPQVTASATDTVWHIKAIHPEGRILDVKATDNEGNIHSVKAIAQNQDPHMMDVKAYVNGSILSVKMLVSPDERIPVKAIGEDGTIYDIKAITATGEKLDVKGLRSERDGNIIQLKAFTADGNKYGIKAISPGGNLMDVKGIKFGEEDVEMKLNGVEVYAHIKAIPMVLDWK